MRETYVVWDMEGYSIPESLDPCSMVQQIKAAIKKEGFGGPVTGTVYCSLIELEDKFWEGKFHVHPIEGEFFLHLVFFFYFLTYTNHLICNLSSGA